MRRLIVSDPRNGDRIFPYIGGEEVNDSPTHAYHRYVINFEDFPLRRKETGHSWFGLTEKTQKEQLREGVVAPDYPKPVAADWPDLLAIVEERVKPERLKLSDDFGRLYWWRFMRARPELKRAIASMPNVLVIPRVSQYATSALIEAKLVFSDQLVVCALSTMSSFAILQSQVHELWARFMASTLEDRLRYTPSDCFETFPFPLAFETNSNVECTGRAYYEFRSELMLRRNEGLTKTYKKFHDRSNVTSDIDELRRLRAVMDRAVLDAYGWLDIQSMCDFFPESDEEEEAEDQTRKKERFRYRWPDNVRDDVLARLLSLNQLRYEEEALAGLHDRADGTRRTRRKSDSDQAEAYDDQGELDL